MAYSLIRAAILGAWLCAPALAQVEGKDTGRGSSLPGGGTEQMRTEQESGRYDFGIEGREEGVLREAPGAVPGTQGRVTPGEQQRRVPGSVEPGRIGEGIPGDEPAGTPEPGRAWGLIVFVIAIVALGLLAFRRRGPAPPAP